MSPQSDAALAAQIDADLRDAMRNKDEIAKLALRAVKTSLTEATKAGADHTISDELVMSVLQREAKRRREAAEEYDKAGATAQAEQERAELAVLEHYLPRQLSEAEIEALAREVIAETGAESPRDMGKVMPVILARSGGAADGKTASQIVRRLLSG